MSLPNEIKSRLSPYLQGTAGLADFRLWFADVIRSANGCSQADQKLIWSVDREFASLLAGRITTSELRKNLERILDSALAASRDEGATQLYHVTFSTKTFVDGSATFGTTLATQQFNLLEGVSKLIFAEPADTESSVVYESKRLLQ